MKRILVVIALLAVCTAVFGQGDYLKARISTTIVPQYLTVTLAGKAIPTGGLGRTTYVYVPFPPPDGVASWGHTPIREGAMSSGAAQAKDRLYSTSGDVGLSMVTDLTGTDESDSLAMWIKPLFYDLTKGTWYTSANDSVFLIWGTIGTVTSSTKSYFNWANGGAYTLSLSGVLQPFAGFVIGIESCMNAYPASSLSIKLGVWVTE
jgi:hypothetical protein